MASSENPEDEWVVVKTTLPIQPLPSNAERHAIETERLILRPFVAEDLAALHEMRTQEEVMYWTKVARIDQDVAETQAKLANFLPPLDVTSYNCAIILKETGQLIGKGGVHMMRGVFGWPEIGYMFRKEAWGKGLATEFARAYLPAWNALPRAEVELKVKRVSVAGEGDLVEERLVGLIESSNSRSANIMRKLGFEKFTEWGDVDSRNPDGRVNILSFAYYPGRALKG